MDNLEILNKLTDEETDVLIKLVVGKNSQAENLLKDEDYKKYLDKIKAKFSLSNENTFTGVVGRFFKKGSDFLYKEMLRNICNQIGVNYKENSSDEKLENCLLSAVLTKAFKNLSKGDKCITELEGADEPYFFYKIFTENEQKAYELSMLIVDTLSETVNHNKLLEIGGAELSNRLKPLAVQINYIITNMDKTIDIAKLAYRFTFPAIIYLVAMKRIKDKPNLVEELIKEKGWINLLDMTKKGYFAEWLENRGLEAENKALEQFFKTENFTDDELIMEICKIFSISKEFLPKHLKNR